MAGVVGQKRCVRIDRGIFSATATAGGYQGETSFGVQSATTDFKDILVNSEGKRLDLPYDLNLWEQTEDPKRPCSVIAPLDPAAFPFDPLLLM